LGTNRFVAVRIEPSRIGTNQVLTMSSTGSVTDSDDKWYAPVPSLSIDSRGWNGPA